MNRKHTNEEVDDDRKRTSDSSIRVSSKRGVDPSHEGVATDPKQFEAGERARRDAESERVDTDLYNTSGNNAEPPKTAEKDFDSGDQAGQNADSK